MQEASQIQTLKEIANQKKIVLQKFLLWNKVNRENMKRVKLILDKLFQRIDENLIKSTQRFNDMKSFFQKMIFQVKSQVNLMGQLNNFEIVNVVQENGQPKNIVNDKFKNCISSFNKDYKEFETSMQAISQRILNQIIQKIYVNKVQADEKILQNNIRQIQSINKKIQKYSLEMSKLLKEFIKNFENSIKLNERGQESSKNTFTDFFLIVSCLQQMTDYLQEFESHFFQLKENAIQLDKVRNQSIQESLVIFINIVNNSLGEENGMIFRESKELLLNVSLDDFADDSFNLTKLLNQDQIQFILMKSEQQELNDFTLKECLKQCLKLNQDDIIPSMYNYMWKGRIKTGCYDVQYISVFMTLDFHFAIYQIENNVLRKQLGDYDIKNFKLQFDYRNQLVEVHMIDQGFFYNSNKSFKMQLIGITLEEAEHNYINFVSQLGYQDILQDRRVSQQTRITDLDISNTSFDTEQQNEQNENLEQIQEQITNENYLVDDNQQEEMIQQDNNQQEEMIQQEDNQQEEMIQENQGFLAESNIQNNQENQEENNGNSHSFEYLNDIQDENQEQEELQNQGQNIIQENVQNQFLFQQQFFLNYQKILLKIYQQYFYL